MSRILEHKITFSTFPHRSHLIITSID